MIRRRTVRATKIEPTINNLEILFLYIKRFKNLKDVQLNFSGHGVYHFEKAGNVSSNTRRC